LNPELTNALAVQASSRVAMTMRIGTMQPGMMLARTMLPAQLGLLARKPPVVRALPAPLENRQLEQSLLQLYPLPSKRPES